MAEGGPGASSEISRDLFWGMAGKLCRIGCTQPSRKQQKRKSKRRKLNCTENSARGRRGRQDRCFRRSTVKVQGLESNRSETYQNTKQADMPWAGREAGRRGQISRGLNNLSMGRRKTAKREEAASGTAQRGGRKGGGKRCGEGRGQGLICTDFQGPQQLSEDRRKLCRLDNNNKRGRARQEQRKGEARRKGKTGNPPRGFPPMLEPSWSEIPIPSQGERDDAEGKP